LVKNVGQATALSLPDISAFDEGTAAGKSIVVSYLTIEMSGINSMPDLQGYPAEVNVTDKYYAKGIRTLLHRGGLSMVNNGIASSIGRFREDSGPLPADCIKPHSELDIQLH
jgi:hypothetical protein